MCMYWELQADVLEHNIRTDWARQGIKNWIQSQRSLERSTKMEEREPEMAKSRGRLQKHWWASLVPLERKLSMTSMLLDWLDVFRDFQWDHVLVCFSVAGINFSDKSNLKKEGLILSHNSNCSPECWESYRKRRLGVLVTWHPQSRTEFNECMLGLSSLSPCL